MLKVTALAAAMLLGCSHAPAPGTARIACDLEAAAVIPVGVLYATPGYQKPLPATAGCVQARVTEEMSQVRTTWQGPVTFKFAVLADGRPAGFEVLHKHLDREVACAVWRAVAGCEWRPGHDPEGRPAALFAILPLMFR